MLVQKRVKDSNITVFSIREYRSIDIQELVDIFNEKKEEGIIHASSFSDDIWYLNDEKIHRKIVFNLDELQYNRVKSKRQIPTYADFIIALKAFVLYQINEIILFSICNIHIFLKNIIKETDFFHPDKQKVLADKKISNNKGYFKMSHHLLEFLEFIQLEDVSDIISLLYYQAESLSQHRVENNGLNQRELSTFDSMFELDYVIEQFWENCTVEEKEKYYPIKLWWSISTILPIRTTELTLTPYDCLEIKDNHYYITLRRTKLKGVHTKQIIRHKIDDDFELHRIRINKDLYNLIYEYREMVDEYDAQANFYYEGCPTVERRFLFSHRSYFKHLFFQGATGAKSKFLDYFDSSNLNILLKQFYKFVLVDKFNYELVAKGQKKLKTYQLEYVNIMDTRHFAFINMALNGVEPLIMKSISGHGSIRSSYHYYSHVDKYVKCYTYNMARKMQNKELAKRGISLVNTRKSKTSELIFKQVFDDKVSDEELQSYKDVFGGKCKSKQKLFEDCMQVNNVCEKCHFFMPTLTETQKSITECVRENEKKISIQVQALKEMVKRYDKFKNFNEDYGLKINIIKTIANQNAILMSKYFI